MTAFGVARPQPLSLRDQVRAERAQAILTVARALFYERGFEQSTTLEIAERAGVGAGTVFKYFPTKDALLFTVMNADLAGVYRLAAEGAPSDANLLIRLNAFFRPVLEFHLQHMELSRAFLRLLVSAAPSEWMKPHADDGPITAGILTTTFVAESAARKELPPEVSIPDLAANCLAIFLDVLNHALLGDPMMRTPFEDLRRRLTLQVIPLVNDRTQS